MAESPRGRRLRVRRAAPPGSRSTSSRRGTRSTGSSAGRAGRVGEREQSRVVLEHVLHPQARLSVLARAQRSSTRSPTRASRSRRPPPTSARIRARTAAASHPYLTLGTPTVDSVVLTAPARTVLTSDERGLPTGRSAVAGTEYDFSRAEGDRRDAARQLLHRPRARRRRRPRRAPVARRRAG